MKRTMMLLLIGGILMLTLFGCGGKVCRVDYDGSKDDFTGAKDTYRAGSTVKLCYGLIATDTDYSFLIDGEPIRADWDEKKGYILRFTMPDHDVKLTVKSVNSMLYVPPAEETAVLRFRSFDGGGPSFTVKIEDPAIAAYTADRFYFDRNHNELDGAAFEEVFTFRGLEPGRTVVVVSARSPIADNYDATYLCAVNDSLEISLELLNTRDVTE